MSSRVGLGFDVHRFSDDPARELVLGGLVIADAPGLVGHSDADVAAHACADALLGAIRLGDLGEHFPDTEPQWERARSVDLLAEVARMVRDAGWELANVDCTLVAEAPLLAKHRPDIEAGLSEAVGGDVSVKATRAEGLGAIGRVEGMACLAVALLERP